MYPVTQEYNEKMKEQTRRIYGKVQIDYTDPFLDQSIQMEASENANVSYPAQTADSIQEPIGKIFSLDGSCNLDGSYILAPGPEDMETHQMGWWGKQLAGMDGALIAPYPTLTATFFSRPIHSLKVAGDAARGEYPVDFIINLYDSSDAILYTEIVTGNTEISWSKSIEPVTQVTKMELIITKWSHPGRQVKILEFFTSIQEVYEGDDILLVHLLEEREVSQGSLPVGNISSNEIDIRLYNRNRKFDAGNKNSPLYETLKANRRIKAWIGTENELVPLGTFWSGDWSAPEDDIYAQTTGRDRLELLRKSTYSNSEVFHVKNYGDISTGKEENMSSSSMYSSAYSPDNLVDGNIVFASGSAFACANGASLPQWHQIDLGELIYINKVRWINNRYTNNLPQNYIIEISKTGEFNGEQKIVASMTNNTTYNDWVEHKFDEVLGRYVRMTVTAITSGSYYELSEWQIFGGKPITLYDLAYEVLNDAGLTEDEYWIDPELQQYTVPYAYFESQSHREALRKIAEACLGQVYCDRNGVIRIEGPSYLEKQTENAMELTQDDYFSKDNPVKWSEIANYIEVETQPLRPDVEQEVYRSNEPVTINAGETKTITAYYNSTPCIDATASIEGTGTIIEATYYAWGATIKVTSSTTGTFTLVINAKPLKILNKEKAIAKDDASIVDNGKLRYVFPQNPLVQTLDIAQTIADKLLQYYKNPRRDIEIDWRGNPALLLGDKIAITDKNEVNNYYVVKQTLEYSGALRAKISGRRV